MFLDYFALTLLIVISLILIYAMIYIDVVPNSQTSDRGFRRSVEGRHRQAGPRPRQILGFGD